MTRGKRCAETLFFDYHRQHQLDIKVVRIFNTYGPRMHPNDGRVISNFIVQSLLGEAITIYGDGLQTRSFCYVDDMVDGIIAMMNDSGDERAGESWQPIGTQHTGSCNTDRRAHRIIFQNRLSFAPSGRSTSAHAGHKQGQCIVQLEAIDLAH